ncbi:MULTISPECIES: helix-turn-helix transcriptional regulator [unclassified Streptomyces]|uniref:ArsR/SmtB family transcription factor n=1 Tax=unclassified Streptomyces TaxID=2593676 RepID=UPI00093AC1C4|nr:winged helix-turn-helix domain-containing protein [Streptomyces sp. TSRI0281]
MPLRIHFTLDDLARTRIADGPAPCIELSTAARQLQERTQLVRLGAWRHRTLSSLHPASRMVFALMPRRGRTTDFLSGTNGATPAELLEQIRSTPRSRLRASLEHTAQYQPLPSWAHKLPDDPLLLQQLCDSLEHVAGRALIPHWQEVQAMTAADAAVRSRQMLSGGVETLLSRINPRRIRWRAPVLEVAMISRLDTDVHLAGQGMLLQPSVFAVEAPVVDLDAVPQPVLTYPVAQLQEGTATPLFAVPPPGEGRAASAVDVIGSMLGHTRAAVLSTIARHPDCSTQQLAALVGIAKASASEHATTLRNAGLINTHRDRHTTAHIATPTGIAVLNAPSGRPCPPITTNTAAVPAARPRGEIHPPGRPSALPGD